MINNIINGKIPGPNGRPIIYDFFYELNRSNHSDLHQKIIDAMTTNETFWFRDTHPFDYFSKTLLPYWNSHQHKDNNVRIWSAACSSGQEPYSLGILCEEYRDKHNSFKSVEVIATDLSSQILKSAKSGRYDKLSMRRGLSGERLKSFFESSCNTQWMVSSQIKRYIQFRLLNLLDPYTALGKFDLIFCRNVLIYFDRDTKSDILKRMHESLKPDGLLCLGSSESLADASLLFKMEHCNPGIMYRAIGK